MKITQKFKKVDFVSFLLLLLFYSNISFSQGLKLAGPEIIKEAEKLDLETLVILLRLIFLQGFLWKIMHHLQENNKVERV